jgi:hypothetical protein
VAPEPNGARLPVPPRSPARASSVPAHPPENSREATAPLQLPPARGARALGGQDHQRVAGASRTLVSARVMTTTMRRRRTPCAQGVPERTRTPPISLKRPPGQSAGTCSASARPWCVLPPCHLFGVSCNCFLLLALEATHTVDFFRLFECFD